ncbi:GNAT family N-acetyltransferase [Algibacter sp. 2305UL17-15]|uniref:GNAT family N-acetyltransferase n=1 Tax=Algibacter sp. 2305UL17-15 TaxID=3231268 RepID=UPI003457480C
MDIQKVSKYQDFIKIEKLAHIIWREHYIAIIGKPQVDYMLKKFQTADFMEQQISDHFQYYLILSNDSEIGYISIKKENQSLFLSKFYILKGYRGKGFGKKALEFVEEKAKELKCKSISLTVNKNNLNSIKAYETLGFKNRGEIIIDIGNGFVMDDFKMEKELD